ncbi:ABC transporter permease [Chitinophaga horti]|uniref:ABC transporter permease n=1 Tax=Chitinophaga horti TaxID=2920382 RepID=A0ABY6J5T1_9BACT|nr:ABC transporter permease [Chitinophaga horti]UYQ94977.1 ABC transporter permease [Chitinophaga horti]
MLATFLHSFQSEWLKKRRSAAAWLTIAGSGLIPAILLIARFTKYKELAAANQSPQVWDTLYGNAWQFMAVLLLPMGVILATSLITQLEFRNNTWKQLFATPTPYAITFFAKLSVILLMLLQFFILFNLGIYLNGVLPALLPGVDYPAAAFPFSTFLAGSGKFLLASLPIITLQYLLSLQFKNFLVPVGVGFGLYVASMIAVSWKYGYLLPYIYNIRSLQGRELAGNTGANIYHFAAGYALIFLVLSFVLYLHKKEKG